MTREEEIQIAAQEYKEDLFGFSLRLKKVLGCDNAELDGEDVMNGECQEESFINGAEWADSHPDIDVRTMTAYKAGYKAAVDKACEWLDCNVDNYLFIDYLNTAGIKWDKFINDFKQAMEGGEE